MAAQTRNTFLDLVADSDTRLQFGRGIRIGRHALIEFQKRQQDEGVSQAELNLKPLRWLMNEVSDDSHGILRCDQGC
ncbi:MAG: hypothetical protein JSS54_14075 [Proteobacteria bacterium]|nr:hypothetical protein [Pseudomonadota bacterium]